MGLTTEELGFNSQHRQTFSSSLQYPDWFWGSLLFCLVGINWGGRGVKLTAYSHLIARLKNCMVLYHHILIYLYAAVFV
jgi:hypothetical protein